MALVVGGLLVFPALQREYFWNWWGSQRIVIERLAAQQRWEAAIERVNRVAAVHPWDPRLAHRRAELQFSQRAARGGNAWADPAVQEAFAQAGRAYFYSAMYPYLMSPSWRARMAQAYLQWSLSARQRQDWLLVAFLLEYAADMDTDNTLSIVPRLREQVERAPEEVAPEVAAAAVRVTLRHGTADEARDVLSQAAPRLEPWEALLLRLQAAKARATREVESRTLHMRHQGEVRRMATSLPVRLFADQWHAEIDRANPSHNFVVTDWLAHTFGGMGAPLTSPADVVERPRERSIFAQQLPLGATAPEIPSPEHTEDRGWILVSDQEVAFAWPEGRAPLGRLWLIARGWQSLGIWPVLEVTVNDGPPQLFYIRGTEWMALPVAWPEGEVIHTLAVHFLNDGGLPLLTPDGQWAGRLEDRNVAFAGIWAEIGTEQGSDRSREDEEDQEKPR